LTERISNFGGDEQGHLEESRDCRIMLKWMSNKRFVTVVREWY